MRTDTLAALLIIVVLLAIGLLSMADRDLDEKDKANAQDRARLYCHAHPQDVLCRSVKP